MAAKEIIAKKYVVRLGDGERDQLATLIRKGSSAESPISSLRLRRNP
jgi:hypothetical protein